jgi:hypothetical protein
MTVDVDLLIRRGGRPLVDILNYCVCSINVDAMFLFLVHEYRVAPTTDKAVAVYEVFCAPAAPARISIENNLPPKDPRILHAIAPYANAYRAPDPPTPSQSEGPSQSEESSDAPWLGNRMLLPPKYFFDSLSSTLRTGPEDPFDRVGRLYDPERTPIENLPGGKMTAAQTHFAEYVWVPRVRPPLVRAGFRRIANIG